MTPGRGRLFMSILMTGAQPAGAQTLFPGEFEFQWPTVASEIVAQDFNGDGHIDVALITFEVVQIMLGQGDGEFLVGEEFRYESPSLDDVVVADFDGDGHADLALVGDRPQDQTPSQITVMLGNGNATFQAPSSFEFESGAREMVGADINGDGATDLIVLGRGSSFVATFLGSGDGSFSPGQKMPFLDAPMGLDAADLDEDGSIDLVITIVDSFADVQGVVVLLNSGDGTFAQLPPVDSGPRGWWVVKAIDFDRDGHQDLLAGGGRVAFLRGNGDGSFEEAVELETLASGYTIWLHDLNGDGAEDLVTRGSLSGGFGVPLSAGDGTLMSASDICAALGMFSFAFADFDEDGGVDIIVSVTQERFMLIRGDGDGGFQTRQRLQTQTPTSDVLIADLNEDGALDLIGANFGFYGLGVDDPGYTLSVYLGDGFGGYTEAPGHPIVWAPRHLIPADFNADGHLDIAVTSSRVSGPVVLLGRGDGTFEPRIEANANHRHDIKGVGGDFNGDGFADLALAPRGEEGIHLLAGHGDGTFAEPILLALDMIPTTAGCADFNADGRPDIVLGRVNSETLLLLSNGDLTFQMSTVPGAFGLSTVIGADFNVDGATDIVGARSALQDDSGKLVAFAGDNSGGFKLSAVSALDEASPRSLTLADFNGDGDPDIAVTYFFANSIHVLFGEGTGAFTDPQWFMGSGSLGTSTTSAADLDRDGDIDLVGGQDCFMISPASDCDHEMVVLLNATPKPLACNPSDLAPTYGVLDFDDVLAFLTAFGKMDPLADLAPAYGVWDFNDVLIFLVVFVEGCR